MCYPHAETLLLPELRPSMAPEDHYRRLVSALSEAGSHSVSTTWASPAMVCALPTCPPHLCTLSVASPPQKRVLAADIKTRIGSVSDPQPFVGRR